MNLVFWTFRDSLLTASQSEILCNSKFIKAVTRPMSSLPPWVNEHKGLVIVVSSAYKINFRLALTLWISFIYIMNSRAPRRSENDNTPQPLDQWTNSPFIGQQVGNYKSFTLTHYLADLFAMHRGPRSIPLCIQYHIQLTSLSFQVSQPSHS